MVDVRRGRESSRPLIAAGTVLRRFWLRTSAFGALTGAEVPFIRRIAAHRRLPASLVSDSGITRNPAARIPVGLLLLALVLTLSACGADAPPPPSPPADGAGDTRLVVEVRPTGEAPGKRRVITELPPGVTAADFEPVPAGTACAAVYGGPATARVDGTLEGRALNTTFDRTDACQIARWDGLEALLGPGSRPRP